MKPAVLLALGAALLAGAPAFAATAPAACETGSPGNEQLDAACTLPALAAPSRWRFQAHFLGSHDDSKVSFTATTLDGAALACAPGSKTASRFEDGEVTLDCRFALPAGPARRLGVALAWHHLQLDRVELVAD